MLDIAASRAGRSYMLLLRTSPWKCIKQFTVRKRSTGEVPTFHTCLLRRLSLATAPRADGMLLGQLQLQYLALAAIVTCAPCYSLPLLLTATAMGWM